jgi:endonuclease/exonuclease/phosphatase family metal-dependent hydrolase
MQRTQRTSKEQRRLQLDTCHVLSGQVWDRVSDHHPVVAMLGIESRNGR